MSVLAEAVVSCPITDDIAMARGCTQQSPAMARTNDCVLRRDLGESTSKAFLHRVPSARTKDSGSAASLKCSYEPFLNSDSNR